jgi:hypothetical protein
VVVSSIMGCSNLYPDDPSPLGVGVTRIKFYNEIFDLSSPDLELEKHASNQAENISTCSVRNDRP